METINALRNTAPKWLKGACDATVRGRFWLAYLRKHGRILMNMNSPSLNWNIRAREAATRKLAAGMGVVYQTLNAHESLQLEWAGLHATDALDYKTTLINRGPNAIVNIFETKMTDLISTVSSRLGAGLYSQNTGQDDELVGIRSACVPHASVDKDDLFAVPSASAMYAGKSVALGAIGGSWSATRAAADRPSSVISTDWPYGQGLAQYDYLTPKMINYKSTRWKNGGNDFRANCESVLKRAHSVLHHLCGDSDAPDAVILSTELGDDLKDRLQARERLYPEHYAKALGFNSSKLLDYNGMVVCTDYDCPSGYGYAVNAQHFELCSLTPNLLFTVGPFFDHKSLSNDFLVGFFGNLRILSPRNLVEIGSYGS